jgi:hypothetical protein
MMSVRLVRRSRTGPTTEFKVVVNGIQVGIAREIGKLLAFKGRNFTRPELIGMLKGE